MMHAAANIVVSYLLIAGFFFCLLWHEREADPDPRITDLVLAAAALLWLPFLIDLALHPTRD